MTLDERARGWRAERRRAVFYETAALSAATGLAAFGALALLDRFATLPRGARIAALAAWAAAQSWIFSRRLWEPWRALTWDAVFSAAAAAWPETGPVLSSAWALRAGPAAPGTSEELRAEHLARAERLAAGLPDRPLFSWSPSPAARRCAAAALAALAANAAWGDRASWTRVLAPWRDAALERWVDVTPGDARLDWGGPAVVSARLKPGAGGADVRASALALETRGSDGVWRALPWTRGDEGGDEWKADALSAPLDYRVRWRDLASGAYRLEPVPPPRWTRATAVVRDSRGERRFTLGEDAVVGARRGDWVEVEGEPDAPLASAALRLSVSASPIELRRDGGSWRGGFLAARDASLSFELVSGDGRRDPSPPTYALSVTADQPPTAELLSPQAPLAASPQDSVMVTFAARDDSAVTRAALVVRAAGGAERALSLPVPSPPRAEVLSDYAWSLAGLAPGTTAEFWIEAWDDASPPQVGRSERGSVEIVDAAADHDAALTARGAADAALDKAAQSAEAARDAAKKGDLAGSAEKTKGLSSDWRDARRALDEWARRAQADPRGDPGLAEEASRSAEEFARAGEEGLPAAEKALAASDAPSAAREQNALAEQARGVQKALREGAKAQAAQDFAQKMDEAGKTADDMASAAQSLAQRGSQGTVSAAELENLERSLAEVDKALEELRRAVKDLPEVTPEQAQGKTSDMPLDAARQSAGDLARALQSGDVAGAARAARALAEQLKRLAQTLDAAGRRAADERGRRGSEAASRVKKAWQDAADAQTRAVEAARGVETARLDGLLGRQREFLSAASGDFDRAVSSWAASSAARPADAALQEAARRLKAGDAATAALMMRDGAVRLRAAGGPGAFADELDGLARRLTHGPPEPAADPARSSAAAGAQSSALDSARALRGELSDAAKNLGYLSGRLAGKVDDAIGEEGAGEGALRRGDSGEGLKRAEAALAILQQGGQDADGASSAAGSAGSAMGTGAGGGVSVIRSSGRGTAGSTGARYERVRLPDADAYRPPQELRDELQRSLAEPRPAADDAAIKEYFKRLAR